MDIPTLSMHVGGSKNEGLFRWIPSSSFRDGENIFDIVLSMMTREFLTDKFLGEVETTIVRY